MPSETRVRYNGVTMESVQTLAFISENVYDDSGVVPMFMRRVATFQGIVRGPGYDTFVTKFNDHRSKLLEPRNRLQVDIYNGSIVLSTLHDVQPSGTASANADADFGPKPISADFREWFGGRAATVVWTVEWKVPFRSDDNDDAQKKILSHRWEQRFGVDRMGYIKRSVRGKIILSRAATPDDLNDPDSFRLHVTPPAIRGFRRERYDWLVSEDGRTLAYEMEDIEAFRRPPPPALDAEGTMEVTLEGSIYTKTFQIMLEGSKYTHPGALVKAAYDAMRRRIDFSLSSGAPREIIKYTSFRESLFSNKISLTVVAQGALPSGGTMVDAGSMGFMAFAVLDDNVNPTEFTQPTPYGAALVKAVSQNVFVQWDDGDLDYSDTLKAQVVRADDVPGAAAGSDDPEELTQSVTARVAATADASIPATILRTLGTVRSSTEQGSNSSYMHVESGYRLSVDNRMVPMIPAAPGADMEVHQLGAPLVIEHHQGFISRLTSPPSLPEIRQKLINSQRRGIVMNMDIQTRDPKIEADTTTLEYSVGFSYALLVPDRPSLTTDNRFKNVTLEGSAGTARSIDRPSLRPPDSQVIVGFTSAPDDQSVAVTIPTSFTV